MFEDRFTEMLRKYPDAVDDKKKFVGLLKDHFPEQQMQVNLISNLYMMGIAEEIQKSSLINKTFAFRFVKTLVDNYGVSRLNADWATAVWCHCYGKEVLRKTCEINLQKEGNGPAISENSNSSGTQYGDLFTYSKSNLGNGLGVTGFNGENKKTIIFQNRSNNAAVIEICNESFVGSAIEEAIITEGISFIGNRTFSDCSSLHQVVLPISIKEIGDGAFQNCTSLKSVSLPFQIEKIGNAAFKNSGLRTISIPKSVYWIGTETFAGCQEINNVVIPNNIDRITESMFADCTSLKKIALHENLTAIEDKAFWGCKNLDFIIIPDSVHSIGTDAFTGTDKQFIIQCSFGSYAEEYCRKQRIKYQLV